MIERVYTTLEKKYLKIADIMFGLGVIFVTIPFFLTKMAFYLIVEINEVGATAQQVATALEGNPLAVGAILASGGISNMLHIIILPAFMISWYYCMRKGILKTTVSSICFLAIFILMIGIMNTLNDLAGLLGLMLQAGML